MELKRSLPWSSDLHLLSLSASWIEFMSPYPIHFISILILYSHLGLVFQKVCIHFSSSPSCYNHFMLLDLMSRIIFGKECKLWRSWLCNFTSSLLLTPTSAQIFSLLFYPQTPSVHIYPFISVIKFSHSCKQQAKLFFSTFLIFLFYRWPMERQKFLDWIVALISLIYFAFNFFVH
jgi:hypothetical protein